LTVRPQKRRLLLISPSSEKLGWERRFQLPPYSLLLVAGATPEEWEVELADEHAGAVPELDGFDLVGLSVMTRQAPRAYELASLYRERGAKVVLGGIHPTVLPDEAQRHADSVVVGEAEPVWPLLLEDMAAGRLAPLYQAPEPEGDLLRIPPARRRLLDGRSYLTAQVIHASRGCPYDCPFCTVTPYFGRHFRYRPADDVLAEIRTFRRDFVLFLDDNLLADPARAVPIIRGLAWSGKKWATQTTLRFGEDPQLLALVAHSGCLGVFVGVEGVSGQSSALAKGRLKSQKADVVKRIQDAGILVEVSFIFGFDDQGEEAFQEAVDFVESCKPCAATFHVLTPYPGTAFFRQFESEGRLLHKDWARYDGTEVVFVPKRMTSARLYRGWVEARKAVHTWPSILSRVAANPHHRFTSLAYNALRKAPNDRLDPAKMETEKQGDRESGKQGDGEPASQD
jgi:radical SAM superfamily enzyme YgiQ (UPF0313 family)